jgi:urease accessory protein
MTITTVDIITSDRHCRFPPLALLRLQSWLSPAFPTGAYSYSRGLEWAVEAGQVHDRKVLSIGWMQIFAMAPDETKRFSSSRLGAAP